MLLTFRWSTVRAGTVDCAVAPRVPELWAMAPDSGVPVRWMIVLGATEPQRLRIQIRSLIWSNSRRAVDS
jgi:hypothetical protein